MTNINISKTLINMCLILLVLTSLVSSSFTLTSRYTYVLPSTNCELNIYIIQTYQKTPLEINISFNLTYSPYIYVYIHNNSFLNISFRNNSEIFVPIVVYNSSKKLTLIEINYLYASNMTIFILSSKGQYIKIVGNVSYINDTRTDISNFISNSNSFSKYNLMYILYILILLISVIVFITLKRYKGH
ncbi:hypothetical protein YN1HA_13350 [Sulfurisphaera ohwakuensis]